jgi:hypothetical protein
MDLLVCIRILMHISYILDMACLLSCFVTVNSVVYENHGMLCNCSSRFDISQMLHLKDCSCSIAPYLVQSYCSFNHNILHLHDNIFLFFQNIKD